MKLEQIEFSDVQGKLDTLLVGDGRPVVLTRDGKPIAVVLPLEEGTDIESVSVSLDPTFISIIQSARRRLNNGEFISLEEMERRFSGDSQPKQRSRPRRSRASAP